MRMLPVLCCALYVALAHVTDECDWTDSGLTWEGSLEGGAGVRPVYLRCAEGVVEWRTPRHALRVVLRLGSSSSTDFRGCVRVRERSGARISTQEVDSLRMLYAGPDDFRHPRTPRCFSSAGGQAVLYVEPLADVTNNLHFRYHLTPHPHLHPECGPCSADLLLRLFCSCDFAVRGRVLQVRPEVELELTEVRVLASRVFRQNAFIFTGTRHHQPTGSVYFPPSCAVPHDQDHFLFLGRLLLDTPTVQCAPRWQHFRLVASRALRTGSSPCNIPHH